MITLTCIIFVGGSRKGVQTVRSELAERYRPLAETVFLPRIDDGAAATICTGTGPFVLEFPTIIGDDIGGGGLRATGAPRPMQGRDMPRYLFNVFDGQIDTDKVGVELKSIEAARHETVRFAGEVLIADAKRMIPGEEWYLDVTDETGLLLFRLEVSFVEAVAAKRFRISH